MLRFIGRKDKQLGAAELDTASYESPLLPNAEHLPLSGV